MFLKIKVIDKINIPEFEVSEFNQAFKEVIESNFNYVRIKGEISERHLEMVRQNAIGYVLKSRNYKNHKNFE